MDTKKALILAALVCGLASIKAGAAETEQVEVPVAGKGNLDLVLKATCQDRGEYYGAKNTTNKARPCDLVLQNNEARDLQKYTVKVTYEGLTPYSGTQTKEVTFTSGQAIPAGDEAPLRYSQEIDVVIGRASTIKARISGLVWGSK